METARLESPTFSPELRALVDSLERREPAHPDEAAGRLAAARVGPADLMPWADWAHPVADSYGRRLVARGPRFELMVMSWAPGDTSAIHDHGATQWGAVRYFGPADHAVFALEDGRLELAARGVTPVGGVAPVDADLVHLMGNPTATPFLSLHLYGCDEATDSITGDARIFDLQERSVQRTDGGVFFCLPEPLIARREPGVAAAPEVLRLHHERMRDRLARIEATTGLDPVLRRRRRRLDLELERIDRGAPPLDPDRERVA